MSSPDYYPSLAHLSLREFDSSSRCWPQSSSSSRLFHPPSRWSLPPCQSNSNHLPSSAFQSASWELSSLPVYPAFAPESTYHLPLSFPDLDFPPSPSDAGSSVSSELSFTPPPRPQSLHVICNAPLIAPKPLPYHSPTFLKFELLPDLDEDLSHPPYTQRPSKRKREERDSSDDFVVQKRRALDSSRLLSPRPPSVSTRHHHKSSTTMINVRHPGHAYRAQR